MFFNEENDVIVIGSKELSLSETLDKLSGLSGRQVADFFYNREIKIPREINMLAIRSVLNSQVMISKQLSLTDEMRYRLLSYPYFSEYQLQNLMTSLANPTLYNAYVRNLWRLIIKNDDVFKIAESEMNYLLLLPRSESTNDFNAFQIQLGEVEYDYENEFDGLTDEEFIAIGKSSTLVELREIGAKYNLNIPRRLKREELEELICERLADDGKLDDDTKAKLSGMSVLMLQRFAKSNGIKLSVELKKDELVDFVLRVGKKADLPRQKKRSNVIQLPENDFEFKEEYVKDIVVPQPKVTPKPVVQEVVQQVVQEVPEDKMVELIKQTVSEMLAAQTPTVTEEKVTEMINSKILSTPSEGGISEEQINQIIADKISSQPKEETISAEQVEQIVAAQISSQPKEQTLTKAEVVEIVMACVSNQPVSVKPEEVQKIVDERLSGFTPATNTITKEEIQSIVIANLDKVSIPQPASVDYELISHIIKSTINEVVASKNVETIFEDTSFIDEDVTEINDMFDPNVQTEIAKQDVCAVQTPEEVVLTKKQLKKQTKQTKKQGKKDKKSSEKQNKKDTKKNIKYKNKALKAIGKRGVANEEDAKLTQEYYYYLQAQELRRINKKRRRNGRILKFIGFILFNFALIYVLYLLAGLTNIQLFDTIVGYIEQYVAPIDSFFNMISDPVINFLGGNK